MSWNSLDPYFNLPNYLDHCRATKPPYSCPYPECEKKVYKSLIGIERHCSQNHRLEEKSERGSREGQGRCSSGLGGRKGSAKWEEEEAETGGEEEDGLNNNETMKSKKRRKDRDDLTLELNQQNSSGSKQHVWTNAQKYVDVQFDGKNYKLNVLEPLEIITSVEENNNVQQILASYKTAMGVSEDINVPKANFQKVANYKISPAPKLANSYYKFIPKRPEELDKAVEYDMDEEDYAWLEQVNAAREASVPENVTPEQFEFIMDRLEKESHFRNFGTPLQGRSSFTMTHFDQDAVCCVCLDSEGDNTNAILFCDMCNLAVHQECYGVPYIPEGQWLCRRCQLSPSAAVDCVLCPNGGGAFKQTTEGKWCHVVCAIWVPEVHFANTVFLEPVEGLSSVPPARWRLRCVVCKQKNVGACIQCHKPTCYTAFHVTCAQSAGVYMKVVPCNDKSPGGTAYGVRKFLFCELHAPLDDDEGQTPQTTPLDSRRLQQRKANEREKIRRARRLLAKNRNAAPQVAVPVVPLDRLEVILSQLEFHGRSKFLPRVVAYWQLKRESRFGVPLLKRLQVYQQSKTQIKAASNVAAATAVGGSETISELNKTRALRQNLERARLLCELIRKRERLKRDYITVASEWAEVRLRPQSALLVELVDLLITKDRFCIFTQPVNEEEVPGYKDVVHVPMDLAIIREKTLKNEYGNFEQLRSDYRVMVNNCLKFNPKNSFFWKYAMRMQRIGYKLLGRYAKELSKSTNVPNGNSSSRMTRYSNMALLSETQLVEELRNTYFSGEEAEQKVPTQNKVAAKKAVAKQETSSALPKKRPILPASVPKSPLSAEEEHSNPTDTEDSEIDDIFIEDDDDLPQPLARKSSRTSAGRKNSRPVRRGIRRVGSLLPKHWDLVWTAHPTIPPSNSKKRLCYLPALVYDPRMPKTGYMNAFGMRLHGPPAEVLSADPHKRSQGLTTHFLVRIFDHDMTWHWSSLDKTYQFNLDEKFDELQLGKPQRSCDRRAVRDAYREALYYKFRLTEDCPKQYREEFVERETADKQAAEAMEKSVREKKVSN